MSRKRKLIPSISMYESTTSLVVPAISLTIERSSPAIAFSKLDLPTFGRPTRVTLMSSLSDSKSFSFGNFSIGKAIIIMVFSEILGVLALSTLMGYISLKTKETTKSIIFGIVITTLYLVGSRFVSPNAKIIAMIFIKIFVLTQTKLFLVNLVGVRK